MRHCIGTIMAGPALIDKNTNQNGLESNPHGFGHRSAMSLPPVPLQAKGHRASTVREPLLIDPKIDESSFQQWRVDSLLGAALDAVTQDVIGLARRALA